MYFIYYIGTSTVWAGNRRRAKFAERSRGAVRALGNWDGFPNQGDDDGKVRLLEALQIASLFRFQGFWGMACELP